MFLPGFLTSISHTMNGAALKMTEEWNIPTNIFAMLIAKSGSGKSPAISLATKGVYKLQEEEEDESPPKKKPKLHDAILPSSDDSSEDSLPEEDREAIMFRKSTRILDTMTPEALLLTLKHGRKELLVVADEFRVG